MKMNVLIVANCPILHKRRIMSFNEHEIILNKAVNCTALFLTVRSICLGKQRHAFGGFARHETDAGLCGLV